MQIKDLMDLTLREVIENYVSVQSLECGYTYGICTSEDAKKIFKKYNVNEEYPEAFHVDNLIDDELLLDDTDPILTYEKLEKIIKNLSISKKGEQKQ